MCLLIVGIILSIVGLIALIAARFPLRKGVTVTGTHGRIAGVILMLALPATLLIAFIGYAIVGSSFENAEGFVNIVVFAIIVAGAYGYARKHEPPAVPPTIPPQEPPAVPPIQ